MKKKAFAALILSVLLFLPRAGFAEEEPKKDPSPAEKIQTLCEAGLIVGDEKGDLALGRPITRAEFSKVIACALNLQEDAAALEKEASPFKDVAETHWAKGYIHALTFAQGDRPLPLIQGYQDGSFLPEKPVSGAEASKIAVILADKSLTAEEAASFGWPDSWIYRAMAFSLPVADCPYNAPATREAVFLTLYDILYTNPDYDTEIARFLYLTDGFNRRRTFDHVAFQEAFLNRLNDARRKNHLRPLVLDKSLEAGAYARAKELALYGNMRIEGERHVRPDKRPYYTAYDYLSHKKPAYFIGENLIQYPLPKTGAGGGAVLLTDPEVLAEECFKAWEKSPGHRDNMLSPMYRKMNIQVYTGPTIRDEDSPSGGILVGALGLSR